MLTLGLNGSFATPQDEFLPDLQLGDLFHDAAACLIKDGDVVCAVEEERLNRAKHTNMFPIQATKACLTAGGISLRDIDRVSFFWEEQHIDTGLGILYMKHPSVALRSARELIITRLSEAFSQDLDPGSIDFWKHHECHGAAAFFQSGLSQSLVVVMDGNGEATSTSIYAADESSLTLLKSYPESKSLGYLYLRATEAIGYQLFDEFKVMGLAPYGDPTSYIGLLRSLTELGPEGEYDLDVAGLQGALLEAGFLARRSGIAFTQQHKDLAASVQAHLQDIVFHVLKYWKHETGLPNLCISGGVAHNSTLNGLLLQSGMFKSLFAHPASHDAGAALGAAFLTARRHCTSKKAPACVRHVFWGPEFDDRGVQESELAAWREFLALEAPEDVCARTAELLASGAVVGWADGRSEFGPRALGHRSILADPRPAENKDRVNKLVKKREEFRPFAPAVLEEHAKEYFEIPEVDCPLDFMGFTVPVRKSMRGVLGAVTHVDGTARVQIVRREVDERFWRLIEYFYEITGVPVLLNTSFNNYAEPIVESVRDCIVAFLSTDLDYLVIGDRIIRRKPMDRIKLLRMGVQLSSLVELAEFVSDASTGSKRVRHVIRRKDLHIISSSLSEEVYHWIIDGGHYSREIDEALGQVIAAEIWSLWQGRFIEMNPDCR